MKKFLLTSVIRITIIFFAIPGFAQEHLVKDINTNPAVFRHSNDYSELFCRCGDYLFFAVPGKELWRTDGTPEGTISLGDILKGSSQGFGGYASMACSNDKTLFFQGNDGTHGWELWTSDGTPSGTKMVKDVTKGSNEHWLSYTPLGFIDNTYFFFADHDYDGVIELWKSNGTEGSTAMVLGFPSFSNASHWVTSDTHHYFLVVNPDTQKNEIWATNGTGLNTVRLLEDYGYGSKASVGDQIMFDLANSLDNTHALWKSDGTVSGTQEVMDFGPQPIQMFSRYNDRLIFDLTNISNETWISDGTPAGTKFLVSGTAFATFVIDNELYAAGHDFLTGNHQIFKTDGDNVEILNTVAGNPGTLSTLNTLAYISNGFVLQHGDESTGRELGFFSLTDNYFSLLKEINPGPSSSVPRAWAMFNDRVFFLADDGEHGTEIWSTDGTLEGTSLLKDIVTETASAFRSAYFSTKEMFVSHDRIYMSVVGNESTGIYTSDGTESGTQLLTEIHPFSFGVVGKVGDDVVFLEGQTFYKIDAVTNEVSLLKDIGAEGSSMQFTTVSTVELEEKLIFRMGTYGGALPYGTEYWVTDGTPEGTQLLKDINPGEADGVSYQIGRFGSKIVFLGIEPGTGEEVWISDATSEGTTLLKDVRPGTEGSQPSGFIMFDDKMFFFADDGVHGNQIWETDGTPQGTKLAVEIDQDSETIEIGYMRPGPGGVYFTMYDAEHGWSLWKTDGTDTGTFMVIDIVPGNDYRLTITILGQVGNLLYFNADDGVHGRELWVTDGTMSGTRLVDIIEGPLGSNPEWIADINGITYFKADASLWRTNGTQQGTLKVSELEPFDILSLNHFAYFKAYHHDYGIELFKVPITKVDQQIITEPIAVKTFGDLPFQIDASATSGLPVMITTDEELSLTGNTATILKPGSVTVTMTQEGDALFNPATVSQTFCILPANPLLTISSTSASGIVLESSAQEGNVWSGPFGEIDGANGKIFTASESGSYRVRVSIEGCESDWSNGELLLITGIENPDDLLTLYPNPTADDVNIKATGYRDDIIVNILNLKGAPVDKLTVRAGETVSYSLQSYPSGVYLIKVNTSQGTVYHKVIKK